METIDAELESAFFVYNPERRTITIVLDDSLTVLGPFKNEDEASTAALEFCMGHHGAPHRSLRHKRLRATLH
ncbi:hypothetical protein QO002_006287 [Pararhizobium capsulatum DSM 1112]|uniref:KTSC domain-containing protein n=1 Tax=Pararhizobium capsulatum DSM 1112 TaxID=1121113 RepID=A0ABU0BZI7_9HYPH|nr:hypothetical protein [Pararhizobium capsulatum DSM 1112]MDQ0324080.1 hypothetical protein [Pararhizobium capsulatum DSM 1112]